MLHAVRDSKVDRGAALPLAIWLDLPKYLDGAEPYFDTVNGNVLYAFDLPSAAGKIVVELNQLRKLRDAGERKQVLSNFIVTGGIVDPVILSSPRYIPLDNKP